MRPFSLASYFTCRLFGDCLRCCIGVWCQKEKKRPHILKSKKVQLGIKNSTLFIYLRLKSPFIKKDFHCFSQCKLDFFSPFTNIFPPVYLLKYICTCLNWDKNYIWEVWFNDFEITYHYHFLQKLHNSHNDFEWIDIIFFKHFFLSQWVYIKKNT